MTAIVEALWLRALQVVRARGLLPANKTALTPGELAAEVERRGEDRLTRLVDGWYYPASYGRVRGWLSDEDAGRLVAELEAENALAEAVPAQTAPAKIAPPVIADPPARRETNCELCGVPVSPDPPDRA